MALLVKALRYKPGGLGFGSRWCQSFRPHYGPGVDSASNRNEYQEYFLGGKGDWDVGLTTLPSSRDDCLEIWEPQTPGTLRAWDCFTFLQVYVLPFISHTQHVGGFIISRNVCM